VNRVAEPSPQHKQSVMPGLDPGIHAPAMLDRRIKPGDDNKKL
jgi:hypothetical protein